MCLILSVSSPSVPTTPLVFTSKSLLCDVKYWLIKSESVYNFISNAGYLIAFDVKESDASERSNFRFESAETVGLILERVPPLALVMFTKFGEILLSSNFSSTSLMLVGESM